MSSTFRVCYSGEWYNTRFVPRQLIDTVSCSRQTSIKAEAAQNATKGELFLQVFTLARAGAAQ